MRNDAKNPLRLPFPVQEQKVQASRSNESPLEPAMDEDFPSQSSLHFTGVRVIALVMVLIGVTLSMLMSFFFLFSGGDLHLPSFTFPSSLSVMSLLSTGGGVSIVLLIVCILIFQRNKKEMVTQRTSIAPGTPLVSSETRTLFPPEPLSRHTDELDLFGLDIRGDQWNTTGWDGELRKRTEKLEALHTRQRLRSLRLYYADDFLRDDDEKNRRYQVKRVNGRIVIKRKTDAMV